MNFVLYSWGGHFGSCSTRGVWHLKSKSGTVCDDILYRARDLKGVAIMRCVVVVDDIARMHNVR